MKKINSKNGHEWFQNNLCQDDFIFENNLVFACFLLFIKIKSISAKCYNIMHII